MDIKKTAVKDVFKIGKEDYSGIYKELDRLLGGNNPFAQFKIGAGQYVWSDARTDSEWHEMQAEASGLKEEQIRLAIAEQRSRIAAKIPAKIVDMLFTVPDNSFIFYNEDGGELRVMLAGWGFRKPVSMKNTPEVTKIKQHTPVDISFLYDGERLKGHEFGIRLHHQVKKLVTTGDGGIFRFENIKVGDQYQLIDIKSGRTFDFKVEEGKAHYDFDLTAYAVVSVHADLDSSPLAGEPMKIDYHGSVECPQTNAGGNAELRVVYHEGEEVLVVMRGERQTKKIERGETAFAFAFETPGEPAMPPEEPAMPVDPEPEEPAMPVDPEPEGPAMPVDPELEEPAMPVDPEPEEPAMPVDPEPEEPERISLAVVDEQSAPMSGARVTLRQNGKHDINVVLDGQGRAEIEKSLFTIGETVLADVRRDSFEYTDIPFTVDADENDYLLQQQNTHASGGAWDIVKQVLVVVAAFVALVWVVWPLFTILAQAVFDAIYG